MRTIAARRINGVIAGVSAAALLVAGCGNGDAGDSKAATSTGSAATAVSTTGAVASGSGTSSATASASASVSAGSSTGSSPAGAAGRGVKVKGANGSDVTLTGPIAAKYSAATQAQRTALGVVLTGDHNAGTRDSGVIFQQFKGGVITAKNADAGTPAYITWGRIRDAWNIERGLDGRPAPDGRNGSAGPLGAVTSDETTAGAVKQTTFEHGRITFDPKTGKVEVTVNGKPVPAGL
ncbi:LGFP repeat-containing protein [Tsukamurella ocularis]|uniref:LGFP repeat-containing protein n=1 Tax=Tsukamurella ocularis TaxID=1970234 RepID=UPI0039F0D125